MGANGRASSTFDYVIIGGGSAGCVLANRLSEDSDQQILLLEAGPPPRGMNVRIPAGFPKLFKSEIDWAFECDAQEGANGRSFFMPRGKTLGGCSSINAMLYLRGHRSDYDGWAKAADESWSYERVLPYFVKSESQERFQDRYHGLDGPMRVSEQRSMLELSRLFVEASVDLGYPKNEDFNGAEQEGFGFFQTTQRNGARESTATAFLEPARSRDNLTVVTEAQVVRVELTDKRATGVLARVSGQDRTFRANREVIVSAGAFHSPHLLMLSGIGEAEQLRQHGIEVQVDRPQVGENLQDHIYATTVYRCSKDVTLDTAEKLNHVFGNLWNYFVHNRGPLTSVVAEAGGFIKTEPSLEAPDIQFHFAPVFFLDHGFTVPGGNGYSLGPTLLRPKSRGTVRLRSADPMTKPAIDPRFLSERADVETLIKGFRLGRDILESEKFTAYREGYFYPSEYLETDEQIEEHVRARMDHIYHPVGTCRMGSDDGAVVDGRLRVRGVENLRVVDASVMPTITGGNTNAPTIMIAEKASDMIKEDR